MAKRLAPFWSYVEPNGDCLEWTGAIHHGYGQYGARPAHRIAYEETVGPIPAGLQIDHLCRNTRCVNPEHLEAVTQRENGLRGYSLPARHARKTHCDYGHAFTPQNTHVAPDGRLPVARGRGRRVKRRLAALIVAIVAAGAAALVAWWDGYDYGYAECAGDLDK